MPWSLFYFYHGTKKKRCDQGMVNGRNFPEVASSPQGGWCRWKPRKRVGGKGVSTTVMTLARRWGRRHGQRYLLWAKDFFWQCSEILECGTAVSEQNHHTELKQSVHRRIGHSCTSAITYCLSVWFLAINAFPEGSVIGEGKGGWGKTTLVSNGKNPKKLSLGKSSKMGLASASPKISTLGPPAGPV